MKTMKTHWLLSVLVLVLSPGPAAAVDGTIEINHAAALAGSVTPGDTPGYPVELTHGGSYRLTSDLSGAVQLALGVTDPVWIDLGGFTIDGGGASDVGVNGSSHADVSVHGGVVRNFASTCVQLGERARVADLILEDCDPVNPLGAIMVGTASVALRNVVDNATDVGIQAGPASILADNLVEGPGTYGLRATSGRNVVTRNTVREAANGIAVTGRSVVRGNLVANSGNGISVSGESVAAGNLVNSGTALGLVAAANAALIDNRAAAVVGTAASAIFCLGGCQLSGNTATDSTTAMRVSSGSNVCRGHTANSGVGVHCNGTDACHIVDSSAIGNSTGFILAPTVSNGFYKGATLNANSTNDVSPSGMDPGFGNSCSGTVPCP